MISNHAAIMTGKLLYFCSCDAENKGAIQAGNLLITLGNI